MVPNQVNGKKDWMLWRVSGPKTDPECCVHRHIVLIKKKKEAIFTQLWTFSSDPHSFQKLFVIVWVHCYSIRNPVLYNYDPTVKRTMNMDFLYFKLSSSGQPHAFSAFTAVLYLLSNCSGLLFYSHISYTQRLEIKQGKCNYKILLYALQVIYPCFREIAFKTHKLWQFFIILKQCYPLGCDVSAS